MSCEKCWADAYMRMLGQPSKDQAEHYRDLLRERAANPCSPEEQKRGRATPEEDEDAAPGPSSGKEGGRDGS